MFLLLVFVTHSFVSVNIYPVARRHVIAWITRFKFNFESERFCNAFGLYKSFRFDFPSNLRPKQAAIDYQLNVPLYLIIV